MGFPFTPPFRPASFFNSVCRAVYSVSANSRAHSTSGIDFGRAFVHVSKCERYPVDEIASPKNSKWSF